MKLKPRERRAFLPSTNHLLAIAFVFVCFQATAAQCKSASVESQTESIGANEVIEYSPRTVRSLRGRVEDANGAAIPNAIIDVFPLSRKIRRALLPAGEPDRDRVRSYHVDHNGEFCIEGLPDGDYRLRIGTTQFAFKHVMMLIKKRSSGSKRLIDITLEVGT